MGISASSQSRVRQTLLNSSEFNSVVNSVYQNSLSLTQHAFRGIKPYQLLSASDQIHASLTLLNYPLFLRWVPSPPTRSQVDYALNTIVSGKGMIVDDEIVLSEDEFREFGIELYANVVVLNAERSIMVRVPVGIAGIVGAGVVMGRGRGLVKVAVAIYTLGSVVAFYFGL